MLTFWLRWIPLHLMSYIVQNGVIWCKTLKNHYFSNFPIPSIHNTIKKHQTMTNYGRIICLLFDYGGCHGIWCPIWCKIGSFVAKTMKNHNFKDISYPNVHYTINIHVGIKSWQFNKVLCELLT